MSVVNVQTCEKCGSDVYLIPRCGNTYCVKCPARLVHAGKCRER